MTFNCLKKTSLFSNLPDGLVKGFANIIQPQLYKEGEILYLEEKTADFCYVVYYGWVKLFHVTLDGTEAITNILTSNHIFGEEAIFHDNKYTHCAQVVGDAKLLPIPLAMLRDQVHNNNDFALNMLSLMYGRCKRQEKEVEHFFVQNAAQRIGCFLLRLCPRDKVNNITIYLPYDKNLIASRLGMKAETFSRSLNKLREQTGIHIRGTCIMIDAISQLTSFTCNACSSTYPCE